VPAKRTHRHGAKTGHHHATHSPKPAKVKGRTPGTGHSALPPLRARARLAAGLDISGHSTGRSPKTAPGQSGGSGPKPGATPVPSPTPAPPVPVQFAGKPRSFGDLFGLGSYVAQRTPGLQVPALVKARATGVRWLREEFTADHLHSQTIGGYRWAPYDRAVRRERTLGFHILGLLDYNNTFTSPNHGYMPHDQMNFLSQDFAEYAYAVARHYRKSIDTWQVWNEPDLRLFWRPYPNASDYALLLTQAYDAIKRANPKAKVVLGGPSGADHDALRYLQRVVNAGGKFDILSMQPYQPVPGPALLTQVQYLRKYRKPVWLTEMGWAGESACQNVCGSEYSQGDRLARLYLVAAYAGVDRLFWYDLRDDGNHAFYEDHFGLLQNNLAKKPSYYAYRLSLFLLNRGELLGVAKLRSQVYAFEIRNHGKVFDIIWNNDLKSYSLNMTWKGAPASVLDWKGSQVMRGTSTAVRMQVPSRSIRYVVPPHFAPRL
jgi:polysaccharide biosynthesis protein PslG